ncbi:MAG: adenylyltransferase/cytidyltransferase family protein, partial [Candidatus Neomarinimicrobiota bacterium]
MNNQVVVAVSGYFDPLHVGHVEFFQLAKELGSKLIVIVNNNQQAEMKKGSFF